MLWMFQRVNYGPITNEKNRALPDLTPREWALMVPTVAMAIVMGVLPNVFLRPMEPSVKRVIERVTGQQPAQDCQAHGRDADAPADDAVRERRLERDPSTLSVPSRATSHND